MTAAWLCMRAQGIHGGKLPADNVHLHLQGSRPSSVLCVPVAPKSLQPDRAAVACPDSGNRLILQGCCMNP